MNQTRKNNALAAKIGYEFADLELLTLALSHRSVGKHNNERLEFLGDSLLNLVITQVLFDKFPDASEGDLTRLRASLVKGETLAQIALDFDLSAHLVLGQGELKSGGHRRLSILADTVEAIIGAIYLEAGMAVCSASVLNWFSSRIDNLSLSSSAKDAKTRLQEYLQEKGQNLPLYHVVEVKGQAHARLFVVECDIGKICPSVVAESSSKRAAEKLSAEKMLRQLDSLGVYS